MVWAYSNVDAVELFVNGNSQGVANLTQYSHVEWDNVAYAPGTLKGVGYVKGVAVVQDVVTTTGAPAGLRISVKDGVGASLTAGCQDIAYLQVCVCVCVRKREGGACAQGASVVCMI